MGKLRNIILLLVTLILTISCSNQSKASPFMISNSQVEIFKSNLVGEYKVTTYWPNEAAPKGGWPVIYLLDGDSFFSTAVSIVNMQSCSRCLLQQGVIVAIDYPEESRRELDYLPKPSKLTPEILSNGKVNTPTQYGGANQFLEFIETELKPVIEQRYHIDKNRQTLFGHSIGGLFVLHTLFTQPKTFNNYIATSPSIWFSDRYILDELTSFTQIVAQQPLQEPIQLMISVGGLEQSLSKNEIFPTEQEQQLRLKHKQSRRMVDNSRELADLLNNAHIFNLQIDYQVYPDQIHHTAPLIALQDALQEVFKKDSAQ